MKTIQNTVYEARDGTRFIVEADALAHEKRLDKLAVIEDIILPLGPVPSDPGCNYANGGGYVQRDLAIAKRCAEGLVKAFAEAKPAHADICRRVLTEGAWLCRAGIIGRVISDCDGDFWRAWSRLSCIDDQGREWGQPYYALNPTKGTQREWKPTPSRVEPGEGERRG